MENGIGRLLEELPAEAREPASALLSARDVVELEPSQGRFGSAFSPGTFVLVEEGFVVARATFAGVSRSVVTCEAGPGALVRAPSHEEELVALSHVRLGVLSAELWDRLLTVQPLAAKLTEALAATLAQKQAALSNFAAPHHSTRVRRKLEQLARAYGHVVRDGIRIDFPVSHALLAEMVGSSRETVTRALDELQHAGVVARMGSTYRLLSSPESV